MTQLVKKDETARLLSPDSPRHYWPHNGEFFPNPSTVPIRTGNGRLKTHVPYLVYHVPLVAAYAALCIPPPPHSYSTLTGNFQLAAQVHPVDFFFPSGRLRRQRRKKEHIVNTTETLTRSRSRWLARHRSCVRLGHSRSNRSMLSTGISAVPVGLVLHHRPHESETGTHITVEL